MRMCGLTEGHGSVQLVLEHVQCVHAVGLRVAVGLAGGPAGGGGQCEWCGVLREAVHVLRDGEGHVDAHRARPVRLAVPVLVEALLPALARLHRRRPGILTHLHTCCISEGCRRGEGGSTQGHTSLVPSLYTARPSSP